MSLGTLSTRTVTVTVDDLVEFGFTDVQIERLTALRDSYPFVEYVENANHWQHLLFLKWRYNNGDLKRS
jgi:hypothetical protein